MSETPVLTEPGAEAIADAFIDGLRLVLPGFLAPKEESNNRPAVEVKRDLHLPAEGYRLEMRPEAITVVASDPAGAFYAAQTLRQLLPAELESKPSPGPLEIPCVDITDSPRFGWRGFMLDICRHFFPIDVLKGFIDQLALHKLNTLHLHLCDDQAWRVEIKKHPKLTEIGAWRPTEKLAKIGEPTIPDPQPYGGFYTQDELRGLVAYAAERFVTIVPEIELPGHCSAALAVYPHLGCTGGPYEIETHWGIFKDVYCPKLETLRFLEEVIEEVLDIFPSTFFHVGGDEVPKDRWKACPRCQETIKREGLKDEDELQSWFIRHFDRFLADRGRRLVGWDEILEGGLAPGATVMSWTGTKGGETAAAAGHDVVMCPVTSWYLDWYNADPAVFEQPKAQPKVSTLRHVHEFDPVTPAMGEAAARHVLGGQANLWTEFIPETTHLQRMAFPRLLAVAERLWSPADCRDFDDFEARLDAHLPRLEAMEMAYFRGPRK